MSIFFLLFLGYFHPLTSITQDLGRHLITGQIILQTHSVPKTNLFSYTYPNFPFVNHHWLSEVFYSLLFQATGFNGLLILNTALILLSFGLIIASVYKKINSLALLSCSLLFIPILFERTDVRPEFFSFLFLSLFIVILYKFREKSTRWIIILPLIELLWTNTHIYFPIGIAVVFLFLADSISPVILNLFQEPDSNKITKPVQRNNIFALFAVLIASSILTLINPNGLKGALYPFEVFQNYGYSIQENQNIFFLWNYSHNPAILFFGISAIFLFLFLILARKKTCPADWFISIFFFILAMTSIRNFPLFVFAAFIPLARSFSKINLSLPKHAKTIFLIFLLILFIFEAQQVYVKNGFGFGAATGAKEGTDFFLKNNLKGPIFNNFDIGSYLIYRLYPKEKVLIDGRPEAYPASFLQTMYIPMQEDSKIFEKMDEKYKFNTIFFSHTDQTPWAETFLKQISQNNKWNMVYLDDFTVIFTKNKNVKPIIKTDYSNMKSLIQLAHFFQNKNFGDEEINIYQKILDLNPSHCPALYNLALRLQEKRNLSSSIFLSKFQNNCQ
ncbi:MAG: hypothetical protein HY425_01275 [Candidatus Levybacteria bacterium]|nr:hypothetical protein [Candidatus Levybacteria bacterium]